VDIIEPLALATQGRELEGKLRQADLPRLLPLLFRSNGKVSANGKVGSSKKEDADREAEDVFYMLSFGVDEGGVPIVTGGVQASLVLQCQRCMEAMVLPVAVNVRLGIVSSRKAAEQLPGGYEPLVVSEADISIATLIEDELILALPVVAMHAIEDCPQGEAYLGSRVGPDEAGPADESTPKRENPFAVLAELTVDKKDHPKNQD
jgi:uncharacterized protein